MRILQRLKHSSFARDTGHLTAGQGLRLLIQAIYFVLICPYPGTEQLWRVRRDRGIGWCALAILRARNEQSFY